MIDIEREVLTLIKTALDATAMTVLVKTAYGSPVYKSSDFPILTVEETANTTYTKSLTQSTTENHAQVTYTFNAYSNKTSNARQECKDILSVVDASMSSKGFIRIAYGDIDNLYDSTITRMVSRYEGVVDVNKKIYRS